jgi:Aspartyl protease/PDZ domain
MRTTLLAVAMLLGCAHSEARPPEAGDGTAVLARFKAASGGARWDTVAGVRSEGTVTAGGLSGPISILQDARSGRSVSRYTLGPISGAQGFDGTVAWQQDPGGEVTSLDAPEAREEARTDAWLAALGYWYPERAPAALRPAGEREVSGARYVVIEATPPQGRTVALWFDPATGLLARTTLRRGADTAITILDDYRDVGGLRMPFHVVTDLIDAAGRTDPRQRTEMRLERVALGVSLDAAAFAMPAMAPSARIADGSGSTSVPFELLNNHIYAAATVDGVPVRVLVDTGGANVLTPAAAKRLGLTSEGKLAGRGVGDEHVDLALAHAGEVRLGNAVLAHPVFYVIDLSPLPAAEGTDSDGLVGFEMFRRFRVTIDYEARVLTLTDPAKFQPAAGAHAVPFEMADRIPIVAGTLDGLPVRLSIDTGSRASLTLHAPFVRANDLVARYAAAPETITGWGVGGPARGRPARLGTLLLGDLAIHDLAGDLYLGNKGAFANPDLSGNLGGGVLRRFTVTFDYDGRRMYLIPNRRFAESDPFDRSGMWLFRDGGALKVVAVTPGGPAEKAGLKTGDRIEQIGGESVSSRPLAEWRARLRELPAGTRLDLSLAGGKRSVKLVLADAIPPHAAPGS